MPSYFDRPGYIHLASGSWAKVKEPSPAVLAARERRSETLAKKTVKIEWFIDEVSDKVSMTLRKRVKIATELVKSKVVQNISRPVVKAIGPKGGKRVFGRSVSGEFPAADTTHLRKTIFGEVRSDVPGVFDGYVGTPLDYGLILETRMNRSFLVRTLNEEAEKVKRVISGPII